MIKPQAPCLVCENKGQLHKRCEKYIRYAELLDKYNQELVKRKDEDKAPWIEKARRYSKAGKQI